MFRGYMMRGNNGNEKDNNKIAADIVRLRVEKARLLGYTSHADYILERNMAKEPEKVLSFLAQIWDAALPVAKAEAAEQQKMVDSEGEKSSWSHGTGSITPKRSARINII